MIFFTPTALLVYHQYFEHRGWCGLSSSKSKSKSSLSSSETKMVKKMMTRVESEQVNMKQLQRRQSRRLSQETLSSSNTVPFERLSSILDRFFHGPYHTMLLSNKRVAWTIIILFTVLTAQGVYFSAQLSPPNQQEEWFTSDHMSTGMMDALSTKFLAGPDSSYIEGAFVWGVSDLDRSKFSMWYVSIYTRLVRYSDCSIFKPNSDIATVRYILNRIYNDDIQKG